MEEETEITPNPGEHFLGTIVALKGGAVLQECGERMAEMVRAVHATGRGGKLTLDIKVVPAIKDSGEVVTIEIDIRERLPRPPLGKTVFFTNELGLLTREDPKQLTFRMERKQ